MERKKYLLTSLVFFAACLLASNYVYGQKQYSEQIYKAYITGNIQQWEQVITQLEASGTPTLAGKLELAEYYYAHIGYLLGVGRNSQAKIYTQRAEELIGKVLQESPDNPAATSLKGVFVAYRMEMNKLKAPILGPQCIRLIKKAYEIDPLNVQAVSDLGNMYYHCPTLFGGDKALGMQYLRQAANLMEQRRQNSGSWFYLNLLTMLAEYETESGSKMRAKEIYEKILVAEPDFVRVRDELYPKLLSSMLPN